ncbi:MAG: hypothetical protein IKT27_07195 [Clostridia bacterium]|nr:hypothetical protein [Clostridia bacterium]
MTKIRKKNGKIFAIVSLLVCFCLSLTLADLFSNVITIKAFNNISTTGKQTGYNFYAISLFDASSESTAKEQVANVIKQGGAGFVWQKENKFYVLASAYLEENDAKMVKSNLEENGTSASVVKIHIPEIAISGTFSSLENTTLNSALKCFKTTYEKLYDTSVSLDTNLKTESESKLEVNEIKNDISKIEVAFSSVFDSKLTTNLLQIKIAITSLLTYLEDLTKFESNGAQPFSYKIKNIYLQSLYLNYTLCKDMI